MKAVIQRVIDASVTVDGVVKGKIGAGLLVYLGVAHNDSEPDADWLADKIVNLRIFNDAEGKMNLSLKDLLARETALQKARETALQETCEVSPQSDQKNRNCACGALVISQFTLLADARKGRRPSWNGAAAPEKAKQLYEYFIEAVRKHGIICEQGEFQAHMMVSYTNDGPVTIVLDTECLK